MRNTPPMAGLEMLQEGPMSHTQVSAGLKALAPRAIKGSRWIALAILASFTLLAMKPAQAQSANTWKSVAIIGGSTAAGAYIGHKVGGSTGTLIGAGAGAAVGYTIDRHRRNNQYNNEYGYGDTGYYGPNAPYAGNGGYYGPDAPYNGNGGYNDGRYGNGYPYPAAYQNNNYSSSNNRSCRRR